MVKPSALAVVTGAARRVGRLFALALARRGYSIVLHYHTSRSVTDQTVQEIAALGCPVYPVQADLTTEQGLNTLIQGIDEALESSDACLKVLVNSAAVMPRASLTELALSDWDATLALNLRAPFYLTQAAAQRMSTGGLVVNVTDVGARKIWVNYPAYVVSKSALETLTRLQARTYAPTVRVNALAFGFVLPSEAMSAAEWNSLLNRTPLGRAVAPEELSLALEFLLDTPSITGQTLVLDSGYSLI
ncbi:MAG: SDR family oxidoreductase [Anaerolineales bacterium]|nr:SDR family oxidoreductase [Anaerolineales bacterium]